MKKLLLSFLMLALAGCTPTVDDGRVDVVATVGMVADVVENVGGDLVDVESLMGPGVDPHLYNPSAGDVKKMADAEVVFYVGLHLEGKMIDAFDALGDKALGVAEKIDESKLIATDEEYEGGSFDPHIWFDVDLWSSVVPEIVEKLVQVDPANAEFYVANGDAYLAELEVLSEWVTGRVAEVPENSRVLVTAHDAFGYFGEAYGFEVKGLQGISTASDFGVKDLEALVNFIVEREIKAIFVESSVAPKAIEALKEGVVAKGWNVEIGGELFSDAMGDAGTVEGTYLGMVKHNVDTIVNALK